MSTSPDPARGTGPNDPRWSDEERSMAPIAFLTFANVITFSILTTFLSRNVAGPITAFVFVLAAWFLPNKRRQIAFVTWFGVAILTAIVVAAIGIAIDRLFPD